MRRPVFAACRLRAGIRFEALAWNAAPSLSPAQIANNHRSRSWFRLHNRPALARRHCGHWRGEEFFAQKAAWVDGYTRPA